MDALLSPGYYQLPVLLLYLSLPTSYDIPFSCRQAPLEWPAALGGGNGSQTDAHDGTSLTYFLLLKNSLLFLGSLRAPRLGLGPHFEFIFSFTFFLCFLGIYYGRGNSSKLETVIL